MHLSEVPCRYTPRQREGKKNSPLNYSPDATMGTQSASNFIFL